MKKILLTVAVTLVAGAAAVAAEGDDRWIHIHVDGSSGDNGRVDIQLPVGLVSSLLPALKSKHGHGAIHIQGDAVDIEEIRGYWNAVRGAKDGEYVTVKDGDSAVRIAKQDGFLRVNVDDDDGSRVRMKLPLPLIDAVLGSGKELDIDTLGKALAKAPHGELLTVDDKDSHVRVWIDAEPAAAREDAR